jgi:tetratricopeptide (TPR) repeat protein
VKAPLAALTLAAAVVVAPPAAQVTPAARFEAANAAYLSGDFGAAAREYQALLDDGWESAPLHANLGNARLRQGQRGQAVASYQRALRLDPGDGDVRKNLALAQAENVDRVLGAQSPPFLARALARLPAAPAAALFAALWVALWLALAARRLLPRARRLLAAGALLAAMGAVAAGGSLAARAAQLGNAEAVVVLAVAPVREGPDRALRPAFELHEGTVVRVIEARGDAFRVRLANGLEGWVAREALVPV